MELWKIIFLSKWVICMFHVNLPGCIYYGWKLKNGLEEEVLILVPMLGVLRVQFNSCFKDGITHARTYHLRSFN